MVGVKYLTESSDYRLNLKKVQNTNPSQYLALSEIGDPCSRNVWYDFHFASKKTFISASLKRLFETGKAMEEVLINNLEATGYRVLEREKNIYGPSGCSKGRIDGKVLGFVEYDGEILLLEFKSANEKNFREFKKIGCKQKDPKIYGQIQRYLGEENLEVCALIFINKNSSKIHIEFVEFNNSYHEDLLIKEKKIIFSDKPTHRAYTKGSRDCKYCGNNLICHENIPPDKNCRTCDNVKMNLDNQWVCKLTTNDLTYKEQLKGCEHWRIGWNL